MTASTKVKASSVLSGGEYSVFVYQRGVFRKALTSPECHLWQRSGAEPVHLAGQFEWVRNF